MGTRRYDLRDPDLDRALEALVERAQQAWGGGESADLSRQILVTGLRLLAKSGGRSGDYRAG